MNDTIISHQLYTVYHHLFTRYGPQHWWPGDTPFEVIVGAILTQSTAWTNVEKAIGNLKQAGALSATALRAMPDDELAGFVRPSGYFNVKARKLKTFVTWLERRCGDDLDALFKTDTMTLREELLAVYGIGEETADSVLLYAGEKPVFVIDAYTRRIVDRLGIDPGGTTYGDYQRRFMNNLPADTRLYNEYHALIVRHGKDTCLKTRPKCDGCCLNPGLPVPDTGFPCSVL